MASIAYISDSNMLEYHRLNGNKTIVFWRISNKKFSDFMPGDLLFFLSKDSNKSQKSEKGIVGCGCYQGNSTLSINQMWNKYQQATGYGTKELLKEAIIKSNKTDEEPKKINCLKLQNVIFFQSPIYLSELGMKISANLESFTYLDKDQGDITLRVLEMADRMGPDCWSSAINEYDFFNHQILFHQLSTIFDLQNIAISFKNTSLQKKVAEKYTDIMWLNRQKQSFLRIEEENTVYYLFSSNIKNQEENFYRSIGEIDYVRTIMEKYGKIKLAVITDSKLNKLQKEYLKNRNIYLEEFID